MESITTNFSSSSSPSSMPCAAAAAAPAKRANSDLDHRVSEKSRRISEKNDSSIVEFGGFTDTVVQCGGQTWNVHRHILCRESSWFEEALRDNMTEASTEVVEIHDLAPDDVEKALRYIYYNDDPTAKLSPKEPTYASQLISIYRWAAYFTLGLQDKALDRLRQYLERVARDIQFRYVTKARAQCARVPSFAAAAAGPKRLALFKDYELDSVLRGAADAFRGGRRDYRDMVQRAFMRFAASTSYLALQDHGFAQRLGDEGGAGAGPFAEAVLRERRYYHGPAARRFHAPYICGLAIRSRVRATGTSAGTSSMTPTTTEAEAAAPADDDGESMREGGNGVGLEREELRWE